MIIYASLLTSYRKALIDNWILWNRWTPSFTLLVHGRVRRKISMCLLILMLENRDTIWPLEIAVGVIISESSQWVDPWSHQNEPRFNIMPVVEIIFRFVVSQVLTILVLWLRDFQKYQKPNFSFIVKHEIVSKRICFLVTYVTFVTKMVWHDLRRMNRSPYRNKLMAFNRG